MSESIVVSNWIYALAEYLASHEGGQPAEAAHFIEYIREFIEDHGIPLDE